MGKSWVVYFLILLSVLADTWFVAYLRNCSQIQIVLLRSMKQSIRRYVSLFAPSVLLLTQTKFPVFDISEVLLWKYALFANVLTVQRVRIASFPLGLAYAYHMALYWEICAKPIKIGLVSTTSGRKCPTVSRWSCSSRSTLLSDDFWHEKNENWFKIAHVSPLQFVCIQIFPLHADHSYLLVIFGI